jgi:hypothetical protein
MEYMGMMVGCASAISKREKAALEKWERENLDGCSVCTSDWPGWKKYIGKPPVPPEGCFSTYRKKPLSHRQRIQVFQRDGFRCVYCQSEENLTIDHRVPESKGGTATFENLQTLCRPCNARKGTTMLDLPGSILVAIPSPS